MIFHFFGNESVFQSLENNTFLWWLNSRRSALLCFYVYLFNSWWCCLWIEFIYFTRFRQHSSHLLRSIYLLFQIIFNFFFNCLLLRWREFSIGLPQQWPITCIYWNYCSWFVFTLSDSLRGLFWRKSIWIIYARILRITLNLDIIFHYYHHINCK